MTSEIGAWTLSFFIRVAHCFFTLPNFVFASCRFQLLPDARGFLYREMLRQLQVGGLHCAWLTAAYDGIFVSARSQTKTTLMVYLLQTQIPLNWHLSAFLQNMFLGYIIWVICVFHGAFWTLPCHRNESIIPTVKLQNVTLHIIISAHKKTTIT